MAGTPENVQLRLGQGMHGRVQLNPSGYCQGHGRYALPCRRWVGHDKTHCFHHQRQAAG